MKSQTNVLFDACWEISSELYNENFSGRFLVCSGIAPFVIAVLSSKEVKSAAKKLREFGKENAIKIIENVFEIPNIEEDRYFD